MPHAEAARAAPPDWDRVQAWALAHVVALAREYGGVELNRAGRAPCPLHGGDHPNLSVAAGKGFHCFTCGAKGDGVALVAALTGRERLDVLRELAPRAGVVLDDCHATHPPRARSGRAPRARAHIPAGSRAEARAEASPGAHAALEAPRALGLVPSLAPAVHRAVWDTLTLTPRGADYLQGRGLDPEAAEAYGFRSLDGPRAWDGVRAVLEASFLPEELHAAGWWGCYATDPDDTPPHVWLPWRGRVPALLLPYWYRGALDGLRFRRLDGRAAVKVLALKDAHHARPFNADALDESAGAELHVCEGELDAFTLHLYGARVVGLPGATWGTGTGAAWLAALADVGRVVTWYDNDKAGHDGRKAFARALADRYGRAWLAERGRAVTLHDDDVNGCHQRGALAEFFTRAEWRT